MHHASWGCCASGSQLRQQATGNAGCWGHAAPGLLLKLQESVNELRGGKDRICYEHGILVLVSILNHYLSSAGTYA
jgi:hypothetical protein